MTQPNSPLPDPTYPSARRRLRGRGRAADRHGGRVLRVRPARYAGQGRHDRRRQRQRGQPVHPATGGDGQAAHGQHRRALRSRQRRPARSASSAGTRSSAEPTTTSWSGVLRRRQAPNSDVLVGDYGNDVNIWAPGDGSDAYIGNQGYDTMIFAPFVEQSNGSLLLTRYGHRPVLPRSTSTPSRPSAARSCEVPPSETARLPVPGAVQRQRQPGRDGPTEGRRAGVLPEPDGGQGQRRRPDRRAPHVPRECGSRGWAGSPARS